MKTKVNVFKMLSVAFVTCALVMTFSCSSSSDRDFADPNNPDQTSATVQLLVTGIEAGSRSGLNIYMVAVASMARDAYYFEPSDPRYTGELLTGPMDPGGFLVGTPWSRRYRAAKDCNILLTRAAEDGNSGAAGFAGTMLAHQLLLNLNYMDENGIRTDVANEVLGPFVSKSEALSFIASTLDTANSALNSAGGSFNFNLSSGWNNFDTPAAMSQANRALRARVAAYQGDWSGVISALSSSFVDVNQSLSLGVYHVYGSGAGDQLNPVYELPTAATIKYYAHPSFEDEAENGDTRFSGKVVVRDARTYDSLTSHLGFAVYPNSDSPVAIVRNEELILLRAEANINLNNLADAQADINAIRAAAGLADVTLTSGNALDQLIHERRYSLFGEGHRWIDMRRWGLLGTLPLDRIETDAVVEMMPIPEAEQQ